MRKYYRYTRRKATWGNVRNMFLNANETPFNKASAMFIGVFIGVMPIWGAQVISAIASAQLFKVNKPIAIVGTHINFTPLFPVLVYFSLRIGALISGNIEIIPTLDEISLSSAKTYFWLYALGCVPVALFTAAVFGGITFIVASYLKYSSKTTQPIILPRRQEAKVA